jgi:all-trans-8'-apo-beta-carotenal 15,15'-oxygenase
MKDHAPLLENAFALESEEGDYTITQIDGQIPAFVRGSYYLNGPSRFARGGLRYRHWLDGDGMVRALHFGADGVRFVNRFVRGSKFSGEEEAGAALFRTFGTKFEDDRLDRGIALVSPLNVSVYPYAGTLLAFGEQGQPWELDPLTLETRGVYNFNGRINPISPFSAHAKIDAASGELFNFGISFSATQPALNLYRFDADAALVYRKRLHLDWPCSTHDFSLSRSYAVFYLSPYLLDIEAMMEGATLMDALKWEPQRLSRLLVARREDGGEVLRLELGDKYCLHLVNSFEDGDHLVMDVIELDQPVYDQYQTVPDLFTQVRRAEPVRYRIDLKRGAVVERRELNYRHMADFPSIDPRLDGVACNDFWMLGIGNTAEAGRKFFDELVHLNWTAGGLAGLYRAPQGHYLGGEPLFIPDPNDAKGGAVICQSFDAARRHSTFLIFNAHDVSAGPAATLHLESPVHLGFHTSFAAAN